MLKLLRELSKDWKLLAWQLGIHPNLNKDDLFESQVRVDVELKLRLAGIEIITDNMSQESSTYLYVHANNERIIVSLQQPVNLVRDENITFIATTWDINTNENYEYKNINISNTRETINDIIYKFINDYLSVNPK